VLDAVCGAVARVPGARLLDRTMDATHNRAVLTLAGEAEPLVDAMVAAAGVAVKLIDLAAHRGIHPRVGALDVCPFVPLFGAPMREAVAAAKRCAERLGAELDIPCYLYEAAAERPERRNLADVRNQGFERLRERLGSDPAWDPDRGPRRIHPTAGATCVRQRDGGLPMVKALGLQLAADRVQVSMNLVDYRVTGVRAAFDAVARAARERGVEVVGSELIGLAPRDALDEATARHVRLRDFDAKRRWIEAFFPDRAPPRN
jgi:glutamate formiminotransferase